MEIIFKKEQTFLNAQFNNESLKYNCQYQNLFLYLSLLMQLSIFKNFGLFKHVTFFNCHEKFKFPGLKK